GLRLPGGRDRRQPPAGAPRRGRPLRRSREARRAGGRAAARAELADAPGRDAGRGPRQRGPAHLGGGGGSDAVRDRVGRPPRGRGVITSPLGASATAPRQAFLRRLARHARLTWASYRMRPSPPFLVLFVNSICNMQCEHCFYWRSLNRRDDLTGEELVTLSR